MTDMERRTAAKQFAADWKGRGDEKQETQAFRLFKARCTNARSAQSTANAEDSAS